MGIRPHPACRFRRMQHVTRASAAALLGLAMATTPLAEANMAYAADTGGGEGTLAVTASTAEAHTFKVYKLLGGDLTKSGAMGYLSNVTTDGCLGDGFWSELDAAGIWDKGVIAQANPQSKAELIANKALTDADGTFTATLARVVAKTASDSDVTATVTTGQSVTLPEGYYVILSDASQPALVAICEDGETDITEKSVPPTVTKEINENRDGEDHWGKDADESTGNAMQYRLTGTINSNIRAYNSYEYAFVDEMDDALEVDTSTVKATLVPDDDADKDTQAPDDKSSEDKDTDDGNVLTNLIKAILGPGGQDASADDKSGTSESVEQHDTQDKARNEAVAEAAAKAGYSARETKVKGDGKTAYLKADGTPVVPEDDDTIEVLCDADGNPLSSTESDGSAWTFHIGGEDLSAYAAKAGSADQGEEPGGGSDDGDAKGDQEKDGATGQIDLTQDAEVSFEGGTLRVAWDDLKAACAKQGHELSATDKVVVTYEASLKDGAATGYDNPHENTVHIEYTHSPTTTDLGKSVPDEANAYTYRIRVLKVSGDSDSGPIGALTGAVADAARAITGSQPAASNAGQPLAGATFKLEGDGKTVTATSGADGTIEFEGLDAAVYKLTEVQAPDGYQPVSGDITVELKTNITDVQGNDFQLTATATGQDTQVTDVDAKGGTATVTVSDAPNPSPGTPQQGTPQQGTSQGSPGSPSASATATATSNPSDSPSGQTSGTTPSTQAPASQTSTKTSSAESMPQTGRGPIAAILTALAAAAAGLGFYFKRRAKDKVARKTAGKRGNDRSGKGA